jgi:hypothetical protein
MLRGARLASISVLAGATATLASLLAVAYVAAAGTAAGTLDPHSLRLASHGTHGHVTARFHPTDAAHKTSLRSVQERRIGNVLLVDVGPDVVSLDDELDGQQKAAAHAGERLLLWLVVEDCKPCAAIEKALEDPEMQSALDGARVVRLDAADFVSELSRLGVPMDAFPSFVILGDDGRAADYLHGGEWDEDVPHNIAPVLKSFADGTYTARRVPWRGGPHDDETAI